MEEKESKKYIHYEAKDDGTGTFESPVLENSFLEKIRVDIVEKTDYMILQAINTIGGKRYRHITVDKNKILEALDKATPRTVIPESTCKLLVCCPRCRMPYAPYRGRKLEKLYTTNYCPKCGQKLDWSEVGGE